MIYFIENFLKKEQCDEFIKFYKYYKWLQEESLVNLNSVEQKSKIRKSNYIRLYSENFLDFNNYIYNRVIEECNKLYKIDIWNNQLEDIKIIKYIKGDYFDWHYDCLDIINTTRKINFSIQLSNYDDYENGDLEFFNINVGFSNEKIKRNKGTLIVYPSFFPHRITILSKGTRYSIVGHLNGPNFR